MKHIYTNEPARWARYIPSLVDTLTQTKRASSRQRGRRTNHLYDWMAHASNLAKVSPAHLRLDHSICTFCNSPATQYHINVACTHPPIVEKRRTMRSRKIDEFFQSYRHQSLPQQHRWITHRLDFVGDNLWVNSEDGGRHLEWELDAPLINASYTG